MVANMAELSMELQISVATPRQSEPALQLLFGHHQPASRAELVADALAQAAAEPATLAGFFVAHRGSRLVGAVWAQTFLGASAAVWPPALGAEEPESTVDQLLEAAVDYLQRAGVRIAQVLLPWEDQAAIRMERAGFERFAELLYFACLEKHFPVYTPDSSLWFETYSPNNHQRFSHLIERTYQQTLDCPGLNGVRRMEDVMAGYRATGSFDARHWLIARGAEQDVGCVLLADHPAAGNMELVYLGVAPEARGQGFGGQILRQAQWVARLAGRRQLVLAVDAQNNPAIEIYRAAGFFGWQRRSVYLRVFSSDAR